MNLTTQIFFLFCATLAVAGALGTVLSRSPLRAAMSLLAHVVALAGVFLTLKAQLLAALQILVYAGAVVVLFIFVIMLIGPTASEVRPEAGLARGLYLRVMAVILTVVATGVLAVALFAVTGPDWASVRIEQAAEGCAGAECLQYGGVARMGRALYQEAYVPFELVSMVLLVAVVGAIAVARGKSGAASQGGK